jgi:hypothetical protein
MHHFLRALGQYHTLKTCLSLVCWMAENLDVMLFPNKLLSSPIQHQLVRRLTDFHLDVILVRRLVVPVASWALQRRVAHQRRLYLVASLSNQGSMRSLASLLFVFEVLLVASDPSR